MANPKVRMYREQSFGHLKGLAGISDRQIAEHLALYAGYVRQVNRLNEELAELRLRGRGNASHPEFAELTRRLGFEYNGMILHEYYFSSLRPAADVMPPQDSKLANALTEAFGSVDQWQIAFKAIDGTSPLHRCVLQEHRLGNGGASPGEGHRDPAGGGCLT